MSDASGTNSDTGGSGQNTHSRETNNNYYNNNRPRNAVVGMENLTLITCSRTPALNLKKVKEVIQYKVIQEARDGFLAAALLNGGLTQTASLSELSQDRIFFCATQGVQEHVNGRKLLGR